MPTDPYADYLTRSKEYKLTTEQAARLAESLGHQYDSTAGTFKPATPRAEQASPSDPLTKVPGLAEALVGLLQKESKRSVRSPFESMTPQGRDTEWKNAFGDKGIAGTLARQSENTLGAWQAQAEAAAKRRSFLDSNPGATSPLVQRFGVDYLTKTAPERAKLIGGHNLTRPVGEFVGGPSVDPFTGRMSYRSASTGLPTTAFLPAPLYGAPNSNTFDEDAKAKADKAAAFLLRKTPSVLDRFLAGSRAS